MTTINMTRHHWIPVAGKLFGSKSPHVPADLIVVFLWTIIGFTVTAVIAVAQQPPLDLEAVVAIVVSP